MVYGQGHGFQGSALPVANTERPMAIPARTRARTNNLLSVSNSILFIESPFLVVKVFDECAYINSTSGDSMRKIYEEISDQGIERLERSGSWKNLRNGY